MFTFSLWGFWLSCIYARAFNHVLWNTTFVKYCYVPLLYYPKHFTCMTQFNSENIVRWVIDEETGSLVTCPRTQWSNDSNLGNFSQKSIL